MVTAFKVIIFLALALQVAFSILYWKWVPSWIKNSYGRLAQLGSWCHIILLSLYLIFIYFGRHFSVIGAEITLLLAFTPLVFYGVLQLMLLKRAVDAVNARSARIEAGFDEPTTDEREAVR